MDKMYMQRYLGEGFARVEQGGRQLFFEYHLPNTLTARRGIFLDARASFS
jgi:hypothetical protein